MKKVRNFKDGEIWYERKRDGLETWTVRKQGTDHIFSSLRQAEDFVEMYQEVPQEKVVDMGLVTVYSTKQEDDNENESQ